MRNWLALAVLAGLLAACGVRGALEPPPGSDPNAPKNEPFVLDGVV